MLWKLRINVNTLKTRTHKVDRKFQQQCSISKFEENFPYISSSDRPFQTKVPLTEKSLE